MTETMTTKYDDARRPARETRKDYHLRNIVLDHELCQRVADWAAGTDCLVRSLCSTGWNDFVSASMCDAAADALMPAGKFPLDDELQADQDDLIAVLQDLADYPDENTAEYVGCSSTDSGFATWLMEEPITNATAWMTPHKV